MEIPKSVVIGGHEFEIIYKDDADFYTKYGTVQMMRNKIALHSDLAQSKKWSVLLHEVLHELNDQHGWGLQEHTLDSLAETIYDFFKRNNFLK